jgi:hypothetical protein
MKKFFVSLLFLACCGSALALPSFDPFADATAGGGTAYIAGDNLAGQIDANAEKWFGIGTTNTGAAVVLTNVALTMPAGLPASTGNSVKLVNQIGPGGRLNVGSHTSGILFYSVALRVDDLGNLIAANTVTRGGGAFNMGFNNSTGSDPGQQNTPTTYAATLYLGSITLGQPDAGYLVGIGRGTGNTNRIWETNAPHHIGDVVFVVASYEYVTGAANDIVRLWINPNPTTFGAANYPTPDVTIDSVTNVSSDGDTATISSFLLANRNAGSPAILIADELRLGTSWADVTGGSTAVIIPSLSISTLDPNTVQLSWRGDATGFTLQGTSQLLSSGTPWADIGAGTTSGTNFVATDSISGMKFYRLKK